MAVNNNNFINSSCMINVSEYHQRLLLGKITRALTDDECFEFDDLLLNDPQFKTAYEEMVSKLPASQVENGFRQADEPGYWKDLALEYHLKAKKKRSWVIKYAAIAAAFTGAAFMSWFFFFHQENDAKAVAEGFNKNGNVQIQLANGKIINLNNEKEIINAGSVSFENDGKSVTYTVKEQPAAGINTVFVPTGKDYKITLSDGSEIWMNSRTTLGFPFYFNGSTREITIEGEAYCKIAKDESRPFILHLPGSAVKVLGTAFNVNTYQSAKTVVSLVEGKIDFTGAGKTRLLQPGKQIIFDGNDFTEEAFDAKITLSWQQGICYLDEADIIEIAGILKRWYGVEVIVDNPVLYEKRFAGIINKNLPLSVFLDDLKVIAKISSSFSGDSVLHVK